MKRIATAILAMTLAGTPLIAHHSFAMFDLDKDVKLVGIVTEMKWQNPHTHIAHPRRQGQGRRPGDGRAVGQSKAGRLPS